MILRGINIYGDPVRWSTQKSAAFTALSFLNTTKYPPSLLFLLMTLGPALLFLWAVDGGTPRFLRPALVLGRVPMFYYLLHFPLIHLLAVAVCYARYGQVHWMFESPTIAQFPDHSAAGLGILLADCLSDLGFRGGRALSALPLVCGIEAAPQRCLAELFLNLPPVAQRRARRAALGWTAEGGRPHVVCGYCLMTVPSRLRISPHPPFRPFSLCVNGDLAAAFSSISIPHPGFSLTQRYPSFISGQPWKISCVRSLNGEYSWMPKL